jgi:two-component system, OmpR family, sensor kinase
MTSLRARLFAAVAALVVTTGFLSGVLAYRWAFDEAIELQDATLLQVAALASRNRVQTDLPLQSGVDPEARISIAELHEAQGDQAASALADLPQSSPDGLQTASLQGDMWRVFVRTRADGSRVAVGQLTAARNEIARGAALRASLPFAALIPCLMVLVGVVIERGFRPVARLAEELDGKQVSLRPLPIAGVPDELRPFIFAINRLLERLADMFDRERRFIADAAHELRTPLAALSVQAENLERSRFDVGSDERFVALKSGIGRTAHLLEQLLDLAKYEGGGARPATALDFDKVVKSVVADFLPIAEARLVDLGFVRIETTPVRVEATALAVVVRNLVDNALRYAPDGGCVDLRVFRDKDRAVLQVEDNGPGVPSEELDRLFDPFKRGLLALGEGTGLGLSIVRRIADGNGGAIRLENVSGDRGTGLRATVSFPLAS